MEVKKNALSEINLNPDNPRNITERKFEKLIGSLLTFPEMLERLRPIVVSNGIIVGGNMRYRALQAIAAMSADEIKRRLSELKDYQKRTEYEQEQTTNYWLEWLKHPTAPTIDASHLSEDKLRQFVIADNGDFGQWDYDELANKWDAEDLSNWGVDVWQDDSFSTGTDIPTGGGSEQTEKGGGMDKLTIMYPKERAQALAELLGLERLEKALYNFDELGGL